MSPSALAGALARALNGEEEEGAEAAAPAAVPAPPSQPQGGRGRGRGRGAAAGRGRGRGSSSAAAAAAAAAAPLPPISTTSTPSLLFLVPSLQAWRSAVGLSDDVLSPHTLSAVQLDALERVARARGRGFLRSELGKKMGIELKNFHYISNHLSERGAVSATPALLAPKTAGRPPSSTTRLHLPRFAPRMRPGQALWEEGEEEGEGGAGGGGGGAQAAAAAGENNDGNNNNNAASPAAAAHVSMGKTVRDDHASIEAVCLRLASISPAATPDGDLKKMLGLPATQPGNRTWRRLRASMVSARYADAVSVRVGGAGKARPALVAGGRRWDGGRALLLSSSFGVGAPGSRSVAGAAGFGAGSSAATGGDRDGDDVDGDDDNDREESEGERDRDREAAEQAMYRSVAGLVVSQPSAPSSAPSSAAAASSVVASVERGLDAQVASLLSHSGDEGVPFLALARAFASGTARGRARLAACRARHGVTEVSRQRGKAVLRVWQAAPELRRSLPPPRPAGGSFLAALALATGGGGGEGQQQQQQQEQQQQQQQQLLLLPAAANDGASSPSVAPLASGETLENTVRRRPPLPPLSDKEERSLDRLLAATTVFLETDDDDDDDDGATPAASAASPLSPASRSFSRRRKAHLSPASLLRLGPQQEERLARVVACARAEGFLLRSKVGRLLREAEDGRAGANPDRRTLDRIVAAAASRGLVARVKLVVAPEEDGKNSQQHQKKKGGKKRKGRKGKKAAAAKKKKRASSATSDDGGDEDYEEGEEEEAATTTTTTTTRARSRLLSAPERPSASSSRPR